MGEQIKVLDLARNLIRLSGFVAGKDIPIRFVGLRPGEKLHEELVGQGEAAVPLPLEKIFQIRAVGLPGFEWFKKQLIALEASAYLDKPGVVVERLKDIVPTFCPMTNSVPSMAPLGFDTADEGVIR
jgi:FlaA1/EpsC-like NDP-sugar epimerase